MISVLVFLGLNNVVYSVTIMKLKAIIGHSGYLSKRVACAFPNFEAKKKKKDCTLKGCM